MNADIGDIVAFETYGSRWYWRLAVVQAKPSDRLREVVVYREKWSQPLGATRRRSNSATVSSSGGDDEDDDEADHDLDATFVDSGKGQQLRTILASSIFYNLGNEDDIMGDGTGIHLDADQQTAVEEAIKRLNNGGAAADGAAATNMITIAPPVDALEATSAPKFKLNLPRNENEDQGAGYIALPLPTGRAQHIYDNDDDGVAPAEKIAHLKAALFDYEAQIKSLIEQCEYLRNTGGGSKSDNLGGLGFGESSATSTSSPLKAAAAGSASSSSATILAAGNDGSNNHLGVPPPMSARPGSINSSTAASPRKSVKINVPDGEKSSATKQPSAQHFDPLSATLNAAGSNDVEALRTQLRAVNKQMAENRIKYEREIQSLRDKNAELTSVFEGWGAVAGTLYGNLTPNAMADLKTARETLHTARATYRKTARKSNTTDTSGEEQLNAAEAILDLQQQMVHFIAHAEGQRSARVASKAGGADASPAASPTISSSPTKAAPKVPTTRPSPSPGAHSPADKHITFESSTSSNNNGIGGAQNPATPNRPAAAATSPRAAGSPVSPPASISKRAQRVVDETHAALTVNTNGGNTSPAVKGLSTDAFDTTTATSSSPCRSPGKEDPLSVTTDANAATSFSLGATADTSASTNPLGFTTTTNDASASTFSGTATLGSAAGTNVSATSTVSKSSKAKPKARPKPLSATAGSPSAAPGPAMGGTMSLLSEFTRACSVMQENQLESDNEVAKLKQQNEENARKIAEMMTQLENMRKLREKELTTLRSQIERLDAASKRDEEAKAKGVEPTRDAKELVKEDLRNMPSASPKKPPE